MFLDKLVPFVKGNSMNHKSSNNLAAETLIEKTPTENLITEHNRISEYAGESRFCFFPQFGKLLLLPGQCSIGYWYFMVMVMVVVKVMVMVMVRAIVHR